MSPGQILPGQMLPLQLKPVQDGPRNLSLKFGQNRVSNSREFKLFRVGGWVAGLSGNIDHLNPIEVEIEVGLGLSLAKNIFPKQKTA